MFDGRELQTMSDEELVDALRRAHGAAAFAQAAEVRAVRELYRRHRAGNAAPGPGGVRAGEFAAAEVSMAVQISEQVAAALIDIGLTLDRLPHTREAFGSGRLDLARVQVIVDNTRGLPTDLLADLERPLVEAAARTTPARLRQTARRWLTRLDGPGERRRREQREDCRDIRLTAVQDGAAVVAGLLPADGAQTVAVRLRDMAQEVCAADPRTMPQRRADALVALADGTGKLRCACGRGKRCTATGSAPGTDTSTTADTPRPLIHIGVSARTLSGAGDDPGQLIGYGPVDADLVRRIAEHADFVLVAEQRAQASAGAYAPNRTGSGIISEREYRCTGEKSEDKESSNRTSEADSAHERCGDKRAASPPSLYGAVPNLADTSIGTLVRTCRFPGCTTPAAASNPVHNGRPGTATITTNDNHVGSEPPAAQAIFLCTHHHRLASHIVQGKTRWQVRQLDADRVQWTSPTGDVRTTVDEDARYLFPHRDSEMPVTEPGSVSTSIVAVGVSALDPGYPIAHHAPIHRRLAEGTPEDCSAVDESFCY